MLDILSFEASKGQTIQQDFCALARRGGETATTGGKMRSYFWT